MEAHALRRMDYIPCEAATGVGNELGSGLAVAIVGGRWRCEAVNEIGQVADVALPPAHVEDVPCLPSLDAILISSRRPYHLPAPGKPLVRSFPPTPRPAYIR